MDELDESAIAVGIPSGSTSLESVPLAVNMYFVFLRPVGTAPRPALVPPVKDLTITYLLGAGALLKILLLTLPSWCGLQIWL